MVMKIEELKTIGNLIAKRGKEECVMSLNTVLIVNAMVLANDLPLQTSQQNNVPGKAIDSLAFIATTIS